MTRTRGSVPLARINTRPESANSASAKLALFGYLNRWNDSMGTQLENGAIESGEKYLKKEGWEVGKHSY